MSPFMTTNSQYIVQKLWNYCNILRDDGMSYGDYVEQLTYLLFLNMAHERTQPPYNQPSRIPPETMTGKACCAAMETNWRRTTATSSKNWANRKACLASSSARRKTKYRTPPSCAA